MSVQCDQRCQYLAVLCKGMMSMVAVWEQIDLSLEVIEREINPC